MGESRVKNFSLLHAASTLGIIEAQKNMSYSRQNPSPRYRELIRLYSDMHREGEKFLGLPPERTFPGSSLFAQAARIKKLVDLTGALTILDYGSGKGKQYDQLKIRTDADEEGSVLDYWGIDHVACYDPAFPPYNKLPQGTFDGVICTDVMEHCPEEDVPWIVEEIFDFATRFVFVNAACFPARKRLPNGENAHCTIRPPEWWEGLFRAAGAKRPSLRWQLWVTYQPPGEAQAAMVERCIDDHNAAPEPAANRR
jgi:hypothetical protein